MSKGKNGKWDGGFLLPVNATNKCGVLFYDPAGAPSFYDEAGISRALISLIKGEGWDVVGMQGEHLVFRPLDS